MTSPSVFGVVLLPDIAASAAIITLSQRLAEIAPSSVVLGTESSLPHITVIHVECAADEAIALWQTTAPMMPPEVPVETFSMYLSPTDGQRLFIGALVHKTAALVSLQAVVATVAREKGITLHTQVGDRYWPHLTLGLWRDPPDAVLPVRDVAVRSTLLN